MKAIILARVSTKEQEEQGHSLPAQTRRLQEYAKKKGFEVVETFSFSESAGNKIRKKFEEVIKYLKDHKDVKVLLCENVDRATRNFKDAVDKVADRSLFFELVRQFAHATGAAKNFAGRLGVDDKNRQEGQGQDRDNSQYVNQVL